MIKNGGKLLLIEIKASGRPRLADAAAPLVPAGVRRAGASGAAVAHRDERRVAGARCVGGAVVEGGVRKLAISACPFAPVMTGSVETSPLVHPRWVAARTRSIVNVVRSARQDDP